MRVLIYAYLATVALGVAIGSEPQHEPLLPEKVVLRSDAVFNVVASPDNAQFKVMAGTEVRVRGYRDGKLLLEHDIGEALVDPEVTDISERSEEAMDVAQRKSALRLQAELQQAQYEAAQARIAALGLKRLIGEVVSVIPGGALFRIEKEDGDREVIALRTGRTGLADDDKLDLTALPTGKTYQYQSAIGSINTVRIWEEIE